MYKFVWSIDNLKNCFDREREREWFCGDFWGKKQNNTVRTIKFLYIFYKTRKRIIINIFWALFIYIMNLSYFWYWLILVWSPILLKLSQFLCKVLKLLLVNLPELLEVFRWWHWPVPSFDHGELYKRQSLEDNAQSKYQPLLFIS